MTTIRPMQPADKEAVLAMMEVFYASPAVLSNGSAAIFSSDFEACINNNPYLEGYMFEENGQIQGYAMAAKSFSTEFGRPFISKRIFVEPALEAYFWNLLKKSILKPSFAWK